jgi:2-phospho-L-lactate guanylyltransferase
MIVAAIPAKGFRHAKQRLVGILTSTERASLARMMLEDVLAVVTASPLGSVYVVTSEPEVAACARQFPVQILIEERSAGHTAAIARAQAVAAVAGADCFLTVPGDVPAVTVEEITAMVDAAHPDRGGVFVPSASGVGTNGVLLCPPDAMPLTFGEPSFEDHIRVARALDLPFTVLHLPGLGLDIDTPDDLRMFLRRGGATRSARFLAEKGVERRVGVAT